MYCIHFTLKIVKYCIIRSCFAEQQENDLDKVYVSKLKAKKYVVAVESLENHS